ncbi:MAG: hypothetical protein H3C47_11225 [Candidatus Cloacimonetes bacterium]|nr:hypothetical protein [Candidatus Cloacimonadota bacterium]
MIKIQTGIRVDKKLLKVIKGLAEKREQSLAGLVEEILCASLLGEQIITQDEKNTVQKLCEIYCLDQQEIRSLMHNSRKDNE